MPTETDGTACLAVPGDDGNVPPGTVDLTGVRVGKWERKAWRSQQRLPRFTDETVIQMRRDAMSGKYLREELARRYRTDSATVRQVMQRVTYKHLDDGLGDAPMRALVAAWGRRKEWKLGRNLSFMVGHPEFFHLQDDAEIERLQQAWSKARRSLQHLDVPTEVLEQVERAVINGLEELQQGGWL